MKTNKLYKYLAAAVTVAMLVGACSEENLRPVLGDSSTFDAPVLNNPATAAPVELLPAIAQDVYEEFEWKRSEYGVQLATNYIIEMDVNEEFNNPENLAETSSTTASITIEKMNNTMLALGLPGFQESTVYLRLKSTINGYANAAPLYSGVISRTATTYQSSDCGNFCSMGVIGDATPGGWDTDVDMRLADATGADKFTWTVTLYLNVGAVKFRASDSWNDNWGASSYPTGTGTQGGENVPIASAGYYKIIFNDNTGEYTFTSLSAPTFTTVGVIGDATPGGWGADTDLTKDPNDPHLWTGTITLTDGEAKFRANDDWADNWGADTYPSGYSFGNGPNIPVKAGTYAVRFHDVTGEYSFMPEDMATPFTTVGVIGDATPGGWGSDTDLIQNPANPFLWSKVITLTEAEAKFRADDDWAVNWGGSSFPGGIGTLGGPNIPVKEGTYFVTFHSGTGEYYFLK